MWCFFVISCLKKSNYELKENHNGLFCRIKSQDSEFKFPVWMIYLMLTKIFTTQVLVNEELKEDLALTKKKKNQSARGCLGLTLGRALSSREILCILFLPNVYFADRKALL